MNNVVLIGRLATDPDLRFIPTTGRAVAMFRLAVNKELSKEVKEEFKQQNKLTAEFIPIVAYGKQAENCSKFTKKGKLCGVEGRISTRSYIDHNGEKKYITEVVAKRVEFLEWSRNRQEQSVDFPDDDNMFIPVDDEEIPF